MAAEGIIKVNPEQLMSTAGEFGGQANSLQASVYRQIPGSSGRYGQNV